MIDRRSGRRAALGIVALSAACASAPRTQPAAEVVAPPPAELDAVLWVLSSAEHDAAGLQAYATAAEALDRALADSGWTAAVEQTGVFASLPPAVIVDVDETALDTSAGQARMLLESGGFDPGVWADWVDTAAADPVPGAVEFLRGAAAKGVTVFYVTNRDAPLEEATRRNLERAGFPVAGDRDVVLLRGERGWSGDKGVRRAAVADSFRVLLVIGDDLGDFVGPPATEEARAEVVRRHADWWGERWILVPNPMYGSWESALWEGRSGLSEADRLEVKRERLRAAP